MRIIALPLAPQPKTVNGKPAEHLTYYHFVTPPEDNKKTSWTNWVVAKSSELWAGLGKAPQGSWKVSIPALPSRLSSSPFPFPRSLFPSPYFLFLFLLPSPPSLSPPATRHPRARARQIPTFAPCYLRTRPPSSNPR